MIAAAGNPLVRLLLKRLLVPLPAPPPPRPNPPEELWLFGAPDQLGGDCFLDGSLFDSELPPTARSLGWAIVSLHDDPSLPMSRAKRAVVAGGLPA
eukprot:7599179-Pyramimonas_sp.AAC.1